MKKMNLVLLGGASLFIGSSYFLWNTLEQRHESKLSEPDLHSSPGKEQVRSGAHTLPQPLTSSSSRPTSQSLANPWSTGPSPHADADHNAASSSSELSPSEPEKEVVSAEELARRQKMQALGYMVPTDYYTKDLKTLRQLAKAGDAYAMVHLGEKYAFELNGQKTNPEFEQGIDYAKAAKQSFKDALVAGNIRSAGIIAELYFQEKNVTEAYAWHLVSDQLGDDISANWFRRTEMAQQATPQVKQAAQLRAGQIMAELKLTKKAG